MPGHWVHTPMVCRVSASGSLPPFHWCWSPRSAMWLLRTCAQVEAEPGMETGQGAWPRFQMMLTVP